MPDKTIQINTSSIFDNFRGHLNNSNQIIFSGKFGSGKTTFIKEFFDNNNKQYNVYHLFPVNYQIASNEDIFDLLKKDLLVEIGENNFTEDNIKNLRDWLKFSGKFLKNNIGNSVDIATSTMDALINPLEYYGFSLSKLGHPFNKLFGLIKKFSDEKYKYQVGEEAVSIQNFLDRAADWVEPDYISELICEKIKNKKGKNKQNVLIIDDLDRIDPAHIFRIFNILSACFDPGTRQENKFGFDKIILVCDINNIRSVYHHIYGQDADFDAYIDKFFDNIYHFSIDSIILDQLESDLRKLLEGDSFPSTNHVQPNLNTIFRIVKLVIVPAIQIRGNKKLTIRKLLKIDPVKINLTDEYFTNIFRNGNQIYIDLMIALRILERMFVSRESLKDTLEEIINQSDISYTNYNKKNSEHINTYEYNSVITGLINNLFVKNKESSETVELFGWHFNIEPELHITKSDNTSMATSVQGLMKLLIGFLDDKDTITIAK